MLASSGLSALLALVATATFATPAAGVTIELQKRDGSSLRNGDGSVNIAALEAETAHLSSKYQRTRASWRYHAFGGADPSARMTREKRDVEKRALAGSLTLSRPTYAKWYGQVTIGTPAQAFEMYFDTGSSDFTVASTACPASSCGAKTRYNVDASSTAVRTSTYVATTFVDGTTSQGPLVRDTVSIAGVSVTSQDVVAASSLSSSVANITSDGMGLAYPSLSSAYSRSFMFTAVAQNQYIYPWFSLGLTNSPTGTSTITFGSYNRRYLNGIVRYFPVATQSGTSTRTYWQIGGSNPYVNNMPAGTRVNHILDSGTTLIVAPTSAAATFWAKVPGSQFYESGYYTYPCATPPTVAFSFGLIASQLYSVLPEEFNLGYLSQDPSRCVGAVVGADLGLGTSWILGDAFLTNVYVIHDIGQNRIGLAPPRH
ncbi:hypothetical protein JCM10908_005246 [Rhodotorula pacifica]|uniref:pepsin-like aspartic protease n=1 Tax=Rhodotorula pacifica TaxID=1495444 RepID=UPI00317211B7